MKSLVERGKKAANLIIKILWGIIHHFVITILDYFISIAVSVAVEVVLLLYSCIMSCCVMLMILLFLLC